MNDEYFLTHALGPTRDVVVVLPIREWKQITCGVTACQPSKLP